MFFKKGFLKNVAEFIVKTSVGALIKLKSYNLQPYETPKLVFSCEFRKTFKSIIFAEHPRATVFGVLVSIDGNTHWFYCSYLKPFHEQSKLENEKKIDAVVYIIRK